jgi:hypothetical protein
MKNSAFLTFLLIAFAVFSCRAQHSVELLWQTDSVFRFSEGVVPEPKGKYLYVSNTDGSPMAKDGKGSISKVGLDGKIINLNWVTTGFNAPKDIQIFNNLLYAADLDEVIVVDITKEAVVQTIKIEGSRLLHNFAIDDKGVVYVSDLFSGTVYKIENGKPSLFLDKLGYAAGMIASDTDLFILTGGNLIKVDKDKNITTLFKGMDQRMNGLARVNDKEFIATSWGGIMYYINADGSNQVLLDTREQRIPCGIIYYDQKKKILYMTTDERNILKAYKVK